MLYMDSTITSSHAAPGIHAAELLRCGCRVNTKTGETYTLCPRHTCSSVARFRELPESLAVNRLPKKEGMNPLCPFCSSQRIHPTNEGAGCLCDDCGYEFAVSEINGYALSVDSKPRVCPTCNAIHYGACSCAQQQEVV